MSDSQDEISDTLSALSPPIALASWGCVIFKSDHRSSRRARSRRARTSRGSASFTLAPIQLKFRKLQSKLIITAFLRMNAQLEGLCHTI